MSTGSRGYPELLASVLPGVRRTQAAIGIAAARLSSSIASATPGEGETQPILQWPGEFDCVIAALATILRRPYIEAAGLLGYSCDPITGRPIGLGRQAIKLLNVGPALLANGIASTIILSEAFGEKGCGVDQTAMRRLLQDRPAMLMICDELPGYSDYHALVWTGRRLFDCRGSEARETQLDKVDVLAALAITVIPPT